MGEFNENYDVASEGVISTEFIDKITKGKDRYVVISGYYNESGVMKLGEILNYFDKKGYSFKQFISRDRVKGELLFERI